MKTIKIIINKRTENKRIMMTLNRSPETTVFQCLKFELAGTKQINMSKFDKRQSLVIIYQ
jgi:hypothetical protein